MKVGFTGTREGMNTLQRKAVRKWLTEHPVEFLHHGDCVGADEQVHKIAMSLRINVVVHPPTKPDFRANVYGAISTREARPYLDRNRCIVNETDRLLAVPKRMYEERRSGTWATIRYARGQVWSITIFWPDGTITEEH